MFAQAKLDWPVILAELPISSRRFRVAMDSPNHIRCCYGVSKQMRWPTVGIVWVGTSAAPDVDRWARRSAAGIDRRARCRQDVLRNRSPEGLATLKSESEGSFRSLLATITRNAFGITIDVVASETKSEGETPAGGTDAIIPLATAHCESLDSTICPRFDRTAPLVRQVLASVESEFRTDDLASIFAGTNLWTDKPPATSPQEPLASRVQTACYQAKSRVLRRTARSRMAESATS